MYGGCGVCVAGKMAKDVGTAIHKCIVVSFLPCLVVFWDSIPIWFFIFFGNFGFGGLDGLD